MKQTLERFVCDFVSISQKRPLPERMISGKGAGLGPKKQYLLCSTNKRVSSVSFLLYTSTHTVPPPALRVPAALMQNGALMVRYVIGRGASNSCLFLSSHVKSK